MARAAASQSTLMLSAGDSVDDGLLQAPRNSTEALATTRALAIAAFRTAVIPAL